MLKFKILFLLVGFIPLTLRADDLVPLESWKNITKKWSSDPSELSYLMTRCGVAYSVMSNYFQATNNNKNIEIREQIQSLNYRSGKFLEYGYEFAQHVGIKEEFFKKRLSLVAEMYTQNLLKNKALTNYAFSKEFESDIDFCASIYNGLNSQKQ